ncbi:MAG: hypothetical protein LBV29_02935 [Azoarcus sp.]|jgi:hypothetical protein|nr:hypothetical protein [Azoarcus sp.]
MTALKASRTAQYPLLAEFTFSFDDTAVDSVNGNTKSFGTGIVFDAIPLPPGATVIGGEVAVETAFAGGVATLGVGDSLNATRYGAAVNLATAGRTALTLTGFRGAGENVRLTVTAAAATAGTVTVRVMYTVKNRSNEVQIA